jgi:threonine/homoserine/homoserine lactone efflux protein
MLLDTLLKGIAAGIIVSLPVGPVGALCMRRALFGGTVYGLISGLGAALADSFYGGLAGFGSTIIHDSLMLERDWLGAAGGLFLLAAGCKTLIRAGTYQLETSKGERLAYAFGSAFLLTLANPFTIIVFAAIFSEIGTEDSSGYASITFLVTGVFLGSMLCWAGLCFAVKQLRHFGPTWLSRVSGAALVVSGAALLGVSLLHLYYAL